VRDESQRENIRRFVNRKFIEWRKEQPGRKAGVVHFADWLDVSRNVVNGCLISGTVPDAENLALMAAKLGDEFYDVCGKERPNPIRRRIDEVFDELPEAAQYKVLDFVYDRLRESRGDYDTAQGGTELDARSA
jgi:hypothetical protein